MPGYQMDGPIGFGADGATWLARATDGSAVAIRGLAAVSPQRHRARTDRLQRLATIDHPHLVSLREVIDTESGQMAVVTRAIPGPTLATLRVGRGGLGVAEAIGVGVQLASALVAMHEAGVVHGDLAPANVVLTPGRGAMLVDLAGEPAWEAGTGGFAAPELDCGSIATTASDVYALARLIIWLVAEAERAALQRLLVPALATEPQRRCRAADVLAILSAHPQAEVGVPDLRTLAGVSLREHAHRDLTRRKVAHRPRHRREPSRTPLLVGALVLVVVLAGATTWLWPGVFAREHDGGPVPTEAGGSARDGGVGDGAEPDRSAADGGEPDGGVADGHADLVDAVHELTRARDAALNDGDGPALTRLTMPESPAAAQDEDLAADLSSGALQVQGSRTEVIDAEALPDGSAAAASHSASRGGGAEGDGADGDASDAAVGWVRAVLHAHEHTRTTDQGVVTVPAQRTCVVLGLHHHQGWLVQQVHTC